MNSLYIRCCGRTTLVCCVGLTGSEFVLPTIAWDLTCKAKLILVITWPNLKKYQIPRWTMSAKTQPACAVMLEVESADHIIKCRAMLWKQEGASGD